MKRIRLLLAALTLTGCTSRFTNVREFNLEQGNPKALVVIDDMPAWSTLGYVDDQDQLHLIRSQLDGLGEQRNLYLSPDRTKVIIESFGEGHQFLSVFVIKDLISKSRRSSGFIKAYRTLDPYPYGFWDIAWVTNDSIRFSAHADMKEFDKKDRRGKTTLDDKIDIARTWIWDLDKDEFEVERVKTSRK